MNLFLLQYAGLRIPQQLYKTSFSVNNPWLSLDDSNQVIGKSPCLAWMMEVMPASSRISANPCILQLLGNPRLLQDANRFPASLNLSILLNSFWMFEKPLPFSGCLQYLLIQ